MSADGRRGACIIIYSQEGRRTSAHKAIPHETWEQQREALAKQGIKRIKKVMP